MSIISLSSWLPFFDNVFKASLAFLYDSSDLSKDFMNASVATISNIFFLSSIRLFVSLIIISDMRSCSSSNSLLLTNDCLLAVSFKFGFFILLIDISPTV